MQKSTVVLLLQKIQNLNIIKIIETSILKAGTVLTLLLKYFMRVESLRKTALGIMIKEVPVLLGLMQISSPLIGFIAEGLL